MRQIDYAQNSIKAPEVRVIKGSLERKRARESANLRAFAVGR